MTFACRIVLPVVAIALTSGCAAIPRINATGEVAGQPIATAVDSALARYYLEHYLHGESADAELTAAIDDVLHEHPADPYDYRALMRLTRASSADFATLYFVDRLYASPANRRAQDAYRALLRQLAGAGAGAVAPQVRARYLVAFVPGFGYRRDRTTGADFARQRAMLNANGFRTVLIETDEIGSIARNADIVAASLDRLAAREDRIILVSVSKGGPEAALALSRGISVETADKVKAWISIGGLLRGSPYADRYSSWPRRWLANAVLTFQGLPSTVVRDLSTRTRRAVFEQLVIPTHILKLQYVGAPLSGQVPAATRGRYEAIRPQGPNDGLTLLADQLVADGIVITEVGLDHYFRAPDIDLKGFALAYVVIGELERRESGSQQ